MEQMIAAKGVAVNHETGSVEAAKWMVINRENWC